ncbi:uncharacterized protein LOC109730105 [Microcebus murinus]|uniref:uncharacterized protein LOC109730105 n=1 Tax=Microcebus murinus TaxID=30608 RepID=UPI003F6BE76E
MAMQTLRVQKALYEGGKGSHGAASEASPLPGEKHGEARPTVQFWEFPNRSAGLRQIFPDASVRCGTLPLGGAARGAERGKRGRAGGLSSHAGKRPPRSRRPQRLRISRRPRVAWGATGRAAQRLRGGRRPPRGTANDRAEGRLAQPILELLQHLFPKQAQSGRRTERRGLLAHTPPLPRPPAPPCGEGSQAVSGPLDGGCCGPGWPWCCGPSLLPSLGRRMQSQRWSVAVSPRLVSDSWLHVIFPLRTPKALELQPASGTEEQTTCVWAKGWPGPELPVPTLPCTGSRSRAFPWMMPALTFVTGQSCSPQGPPRRAWESAACRVSG